MTRKNVGAALRPRSSKTGAGAVGASLWTRSLRVGATVIVIAAIAAAGTATWQYRDLLPAWPEEGIAPVKRVLVEGPFERVTTDEVENAVLPYLAGGFFTVDLPAIREAAEGLPWVARAQVMRVWPDAIHIVVTEQAAAWRWGADGLLNESAELFVTGVEDRPATLPRLDGPAGMERAMAEYYLAVDAALARCGQRARRLEMDGRRAVRVTLDSGPVIEFGRDPGERRVARFCDAVAGALRPRFDEVAVVDMRYTNGFAVGWREGG